eukprot:scaffold32199_cov108-Isochrysis_galbana.AAC.5
MQVPSEACARQAGVVSEGWYAGAGYTARRPAMEEREEACGGMAQNRTEARQSQCAENKNSHPAGRAERPRGVSWRPQRRPTPLRTASWRRTVRAQQPRLPTRPARREAHSAAPVAPRGPPAQSGPPVHSRQQWPVTLAAPRRFLFALRTVGRHHAADGASRARGAASGAFAAPSTARPAHWAAEGHHAKGSVAPSGGGLLRSSPARSSRRSHHRAARMHRPPRRSGQPENQRNPSLRAWSRPPSSAACVAHPESACSARPRPHAHPTARTERRRCSRASRAARAASSTPLLLQGCSRPLASRRAPASQTGPGPDRARARAWPGPSLGASGPAPAVRPGALRRTRSRNAACVLPAASAGESV